MRIAKRISISTGTVLAAAGLAVAGAPATTAASIGPALTAATVPVFQIPSIGVQVNGLVVPGPLVVSVKASSPASGQTTFTAPASPETCSTNAAGALVRIVYVNLGSGATGSTTVKMCPNFLEPAPVESTVDTGSGPVAITVAIHGSSVYPNAGQPSLPGVGGFIAP